MEIKELLKIAFRAGQQVEISGIILDDDAEFDEWIEENQHLVKSVDSDDVGETFNEYTTQVGMNRCTSCGSAYCDGKICT